MADTNFQINQGTTWIQQLIYEDPTGTPIDLTGYTAKMELRTDFNSPYVFATLSTTTGEITITSLTGQIQLELSAVVTSALKPYTYLYDLVITSSMGIVTRLISGRVTVLPEVTK